MSVIELFDMTSSDEIWITEHDRDRPCHSNRNIVLSNIFEHDNKSIHFIFFAIKRRYIDCNYIFNLTIHC